MVGNEGYLVPLPTLSLMRFIRSRQPGQVGNRRVYPAKGLLRLIPKWYTSNNQQ